MPPPLLSLPLGLGFGLGLGFNRARILEPEWKNEGTFGILVMDIIILIIMGLAHAVDGNGMDVGPMWDGKGGGGA